MPTRRRFLRQAAAAGLAGTASVSLSRFARAGAPPESGPARVYVDPERKLGTIDRNLFGSFLEHLGRAIYDGIYEPGSSLSDAKGFRKDVMDVVRNLGVTIIRYPGGNFVSGYNWLDGIGPKDKRPKVLDKAWNTIDSNQFGTDEFMAWCKAVGTLPLMGLNLGTGTPEQAAALVEYCNVEKGTEWSELRRKNGVAEPYNVKHWCLGNEMDGPWQIGHVPAEEYGLKAADAARQMRMVDPSLVLVACGSSGPGMPTYLEWDRQVLDQCYEYVDGLSLHRYLGNDGETGGVSSKYVAMNLSLERQIEQTAAVCDVVQAERRSKKQLFLSFDEWNVWYRARGPKYDNGHRTEAPHLLEEIYNLEDALLVGGILNSLMRHAARVRIACLAQLVNVIAPIMTNEQGLFLQTIYYPYSWALRYGRGDVLELLVESPTYDAAGLGQVEYLDVTGTRNPEDGSTTLFVLNRDLDKPRQVEVVWEGAAPSRLAAGQVMTGDDLKAFNSFEQPKHVVPRDFDGTAVANSAGHTTFEAPARSYTVLQWSA
jgi:alpha-L-arabinofuranosidase